MSRRDDDRRPPASARPDHASATARSRPSPASSTAVVPTAATTSAPPAGPRRRVDVTRRSFLVRTAIFASALVVNPLRYILRPGQRVRGGVRRRSVVLVGLDRVLLHGQQRPEQLPARHESRGVVEGRQLVVLQLRPALLHRLQRVVRHRAVAAGSGLCDRGCAACNCHCASGECDQRFTCCNEFRYGQCHQDLACVGPIVCRVVTCVAPWDFDATCSTTSATANSTGTHDAPCLHGFNSSVLAFGAAADHGAPRGQTAGADRRHRGDAPGQRLLARRARRRRVQLRRRALPRIHRWSSTSTSRSSTSPAPGAGTATGSSPPTAASSRSATRASSARWAGCA